MTFTERLTMGLELAKTLAAIAVPIVIAVVGNEYNATIKDSENRVRYVELAVATLRAEPSPESKALREWAIELLDSQAPVKLTKAAREELSTRRLNTTAPGTVISGSSSIISGRPSVSD